MIHPKKNIVFREALEPLETDPNVGLTELQVAERTRKGWANGTPRSAGKTEGQIVAENTLVNQAQQKSAEMIRVAEERCRELRRAANEYCEDALRRTEEAVAEAFEEIKQSRSRFRAAAGQPAQNSGRQVYDAAKDED